MSTLTKCTSCKGTKTLMGMGMIMKKCHYCDGVGYKEHKAEIIETQNGKDVKPVTVIKKKMGRPARKHLDMVSNG